MKRTLTTARAMAALLILLPGAAVAEAWLDPPAPDGLRPGGTISQTLDAPPMATVVERRVREVRNYPEQPPVIPHTIRDYQVDRRFNRCLDCHSREAAPGMGAPMVSVTHFMDRHKQVLAAVSPDRYFCTQCHVEQTDAQPLVTNRFRAVDDVLAELVEPSER
jgi:nitrate reductase (cytochrome), electron transfer subunit